MKEMPPSFARATAILSSDTACITAETSGMFMVKAGSYPFLNFTTGVFRLTLSTIHSLEEYPGTSRYSLKVLEGSVK